MADQPHMPTDATPPLRGRAFWRSLDELADTDEFRQWLHREFPAGATELAGVNRREFLKVMAASFALAGLEGCTRTPTEHIAPYVRDPETIVPGKPLYLATALTRGGYARGAWVQSHTGRPTKVEGNPLHPASLGATDIFMQAEILSFYDPDRSQTVTQGGDIGTWEMFGRVMSTRLAAMRRQGGRGLRLLTGTITSPTLLGQIANLLQMFPEARWHRYEPIGDDPGRAGAAAAFGQPVEFVYRFDRAARIVSFDDDFLFASPGNVRYARDFADRRRLRVGGELEPRDMNRLYVVEPTLSLTGANADHRLPMRASRIPAVVQHLAQALGVRGVVGEDMPPLDEATQRWVRAVAADLREHPGESLVLAGPTQPAGVHALVHAMNAALQNVGQTAVPIEPVASTLGGQAASVEALARAMAQDEVSTLLAIGVNPAYDTPADLDFARLLGEVPFTAHMGLYRDETALLCDWHLPLAHELESWSDARAFDGTATILQPLIAPLYRGRTPHDLLALVTGDTTLTAYDLVRQWWQSWAGLSGEAFEAWWRDALRQGVVPQTAAEAASVQLDRAAVREAATQLAAADGEAVEIVYKPDATLWDGRYANNGWLQELPKPLTKITWDNAALLSPATAKRLGVEEQQVVVVEYAGRAIEAPVWYMPGQADDCVVLSLGYGRPAAGRVGADLGYNAYHLRTTGAMWVGGGAALRPTEKRYPLASAQNHHTLEGRNMVRAGTLAQFAREPREIVHVEHAEPTTDLPLTLYPEYAYTGQQWGMSIDLTTCIGCGACTAACQAENNIPVVGKEGVSRGREMHWIRVDRYFAGSVERPEVYHEPVPCMHCEKAPCELVCPTEATKHSPDGLNEMIYNRCIGTRYCSNNCPYKVRRFNFYDYVRETPETLRMQRNPDVTVRDRGVMEKCTYCVQRIRTAGINAKKDNRPILDGEVVTACQQACPTNAIVFGDINDADTKVAFEKRQPHDYGILEELNTQPRTTYLAAIRNPNPALEARA